MVDFRNALEEGFLLRLPNREGGAVPYTICREIGRGGSCIVYEASYETNAGDRKLVRIKECYPYRLRIDRGSRGDLLPDSVDRVVFEAAQEKMWQDFRLWNRLFYLDGLEGSLVDHLNIHRANQTTYVVSAYSSRDTLAAFRPGSLCSCISLVRQVAGVLDRIHQAGYLYLDMKPDNVLVVKGQEERVQLFDFDSLVALSEVGKGAGENQVRLSYTKGFAAVELETARIDHLGPWTDVYGVGALLFYLLFGAPPAAADCEPDAEYDFSGMAYADAQYQDRLFFALTDFFHGTLANYYRKRDPDMQTVIGRLEEIEGYADSAVPFLCSTRLPAPELLVGREQELRRLEQWACRENSPCLYVTGMGGIGKSTLVRGFLAEDRGRFDALLYLRYRDSLLRTLTDDAQAKINTVEKNEAESQRDYFLRKLACFRKLAAASSVLLVLDDFTGEGDLDLPAVLSIGWKVLLISRRRPLAGKERVLEVAAIRDPKELRLLFEANLGRRIREAERADLERILGRIDGHTLVLELIAKQIAASYLTVAEAARLVGEHGFSQIAPEKVAYGKDLVARQETVGAVIDALFEAESLTEDKRILLKVMSLLGPEGTDAPLFQELLGLETKDGFNELIREGWLEQSGLQLSLHPVIREAVGRWEWREEYQAAAAGMMEALFWRMRLESGGEDYPEKRGDFLQWTKDYPAFRKVRRWLGRSSRQNQAAEEAACGQQERSGDRERLPRQNQAAAEAACGQQERSGDQERLPRQNQAAAGAACGQQERSGDRERLRQYVALAEGILNSCRGETPLAGTASYKELLYCTLRNMPRWREDFILERAGELLEDPSCPNGAALMRLFSQVAAIYEERGEFEAAFAKIREAVRVKKRSHSHLASARYYDMLADFYDERLNGAYEPVTSEEQADLTALKRAIDRAIFHGKRCRETEGKLLLAESLLAKATVLMRSSPGERKRIDRLLISARKLIETYAKSDANVWFTYDMVFAWYFTLIVPDDEAALEAMVRAREISAQVCATDLDEIDNFTSPCANLFLEQGQVEKAAALIAGAIGVCERQGEVLPYTRKKLELYHHALDIAQVAGDEEKCQELEEKIRVLVLEQAEKNR